MSALFWFIVAFEEELGGHSSGGLGGGEMLWRGGGRCGTFEKHTKLL